MNLLQTIDRISEMILRGDAPDTIKPVIMSLRDHAEALQNEVIALNAAKSEAQLDEQEEYMQTLLSEASATIDRQAEEIKRLREAAGEKDWHEAQYAEERRTILEMIAKDRWLNERDLLSRLEISEERLRFQLSEMEKVRWIKLRGTYPDPDRPPAWELTHEGRSELMRRGKL